MLVVEIIINSKEKLQNRDTDFIINWSYSKKLKESTKALSLLPHSYKEESLVVMKFTLHFAE